MTKQNCKKLKLQELLIKYIKISCTKQKKLFKKVKNKAFAHLSLYSIIITT